MKSQALNFKNIVDTIYALPLEDREEIKTLLEHNIADARRNEIANNFKKTLEEVKTGDIEFSSNINDLRKML